CCGIERWSPEFRSGLRYQRDRISPVDPGPPRCERCEKFIRRGAATTYVFSISPQMGNLGNPSSTAQLEFRWTPPYFVPVSSYSLIGSRKKFSVIFDRSRQLHSLLQSSPIP